MRRDLTVPELKQHSKLWLLARSQRQRQATLTPMLLTKGWRQGTAMHSWVAPAFTRRLDDRFSRPGLGYSVAYWGTQNAFGMEGLKRAIIHANDEGKGIIGGWFYAGDGKFYFDSVCHYSNLMSAYNAARRNRQIGFYDLGRSAYIKTERTFQKILDRMKRLDEIDYRDGRIVALKPEEHR